MNTASLFILTCATLLEISVCSESLEKNLTSYCEFPRYDVGDRVLLSRKKRYLTFPRGSAFTSTVSVVKALLYQQTTPTNLVIEYDVIWPIPSNEEDRERNAEKRIYSKKIQKPSRWRLHRRHRRELYSAYEAALDRYGLPGKECVLRTICEARIILSPPGVSFVEDVLRIILSNFSTSRKEMDEYDAAYGSKRDCDLKYSCPFSILELLLSFDQNSIT